MFGLGPVEIVLLGAIAVMLYGKQLPDVGRSLGKTVGELRKQWTTLARELDVSHYVDGSTTASGGSRHSLPAARREDEAPLVAGPRFDPPSDAG
jgi:sec-independent protein translocase protein TatA